MSTAKTENQEGFKNTSKVITTITHEGIEYSFSVSLKGIADLEKQTGKKLVDFITDYDVNLSIQLCKMGMICGAKNRKLEDVEKSITDQLVCEIMDSQMGLYGDVYKTYAEAFSRLNNIQTEGN